MENKCKKCGAQTSWEDAIFCVACQKGFDMWLQEGNERVKSFNALDVTHLSLGRGTSSDLYPESKTLLMNMPLFNRFGKSNYSRFMRISQKDWGYMK
jgi:hypothetical protein